MTDHPQPAGGPVDGVPEADLPPADTDAGPLDPDELAARLTVDPARDDVKG